MWQQVYGYLSEWDFVQGPVLYTLGALLLCVLFAVQ